MVSVAEAQTYIDSWYAAFPGAKEYFDRQEQEVIREQGFQTLLGRYRRLPTVNSSNREERSKELRQARNRMLCDASDILIIVMLLIEHDPELKELFVQMLLQIHDELVLEAPDNTEILWKATERIKYLMEHGLELVGINFSVPLTVEGSFAYSWGQAK